MVAAYKAVLGHTFSAIIYNINKSKLNCMQRLCDWIKGRSPLNKCVVH